MIINHNMPAMNALRMNFSNTGSIKKNMEKLSSGYKVNRAADDAASLSISEKLRQQIRGLGMANQNAWDAISFLNVADGAMNEMHSIINRLSELSVRAANDTFALEDRQSIQEETNQLLKEFDRIIESTEFNRQPIFQNSKFRKQDGTYNLGTVLGAGNFAPISNLGQQTTLGAGWNTTGNPSAPAGIAGDAGAIGLTYASVFLDFSDFGTNYGISDLHNMGFNSTCATCDRHYSLLFIDGGGNTTNSDGVSYNYISNYYYPSLQVDISGVTSGDDIVFRIMSAATSATNFTDHFTQYARDPADPTKLYIYDNRDYLSGTGGSSSFDLVALNENGEPITNDEPESLWIQTGANAEEGLWLDKPIFTLDSLGIRHLNMLSHQAAGQSLEEVRIAQRIVSEKRSAVGAYTNRLEYTVRNIDNYQENLSAAESRIRDTDMAKESMEFLKNNILLQSSQMMLAQANQLSGFVQKLLQ